MTPIVHEFEKRNVDLFLLHTGQHYTDTMSRLFFQDMELREPDANLNIGSGTHSEQTAKALVGVEKELMKQKPDLVLVQGDTNAVLSASLAAVKLNIPVGHVEAGLRSYDTRMPEEHNRRVADHLSSFLFAPTDRSAEILREESVWGKVFVTGNTVIDSVEWLVNKVEGRKTVADGLGLKDFALLTLHRSENVDDRAILAGLVHGILELNTNIVFPAHPRTMSRLTSFGLIDDIRKSKRIHLIEPVGYLDFLALMKTCRFVLTDSGGIQEEATAPSINKRVFVLRTSTERPEAIESGHATVVGVDSDVFPAIVKREARQNLLQTKVHPYGTGDASVKIVDILEEYLK
jgi:UDP-N-acetylglucosamine 2-epimerase (non-hydrolysing)